MRIGIDVTAALAGGGYRRYAESLLEALVRRHPDHEYFLIGVFWRGFPERFERLALPSGPRVRRVLRRWPQRLLLPAEEYLGLRLQERMLAGLGLDLLHGLGSLLPRLDRLPSVVTLHYAGPWPFAAGWERFYFERLTASSVRQARRVIAISEFTKAEALKTWALDPAKVVVAPHGGPGPAFAPAAPEQGANRPYFLFVGTTIPQKNAALLAQAFVRLARLRPGHRLVLAGAEGPEGPRVRAILEAGGAATRAEFHGPVPHQDIHRLYQRAQALVCPSLQEGFAFPALEAMACGVPVIGVAAGALTETLGDAGLLVPPEAAALSAAMDRLAGDPALRADLVQRGLRRVRLYSWDETADRTMQAYEAVRRG